MITVRSDYYEFAVTDGDGTLIDYGVVPVSSEKVIDLSDMLEYWTGHTVIFAPCADDCETGR